MIDTHAHLAFFKDIEDILKRAKNIKKIIDIAVSKEALLNSLNLRKTHKNIYTAAAVAPHDVEKKESKAFFSDIEKYTKEKKLIAIGETGLEYHYNISKSLQKDFLKRHILLAKENSLPIIFHCRDAFSDLFFEGRDIKKAVIHCFTGGEMEAMQATERGWYISFSGIVTFKNSRPIQKALKNIPIEKVLIETDSPYLAPQKYRGKRNEPAYIFEVAKAVASIKELDIKEVIDITTKNAEKLFSI